MEKEANDNSRLCTLKVSKGRGVTRTGERQAGESEKRRVMEGVRGGERTRERHTGRQRERDRERERQRERQRETHLVV